MIADLFLFMAAGFFAGYLWGKLTHRWPIEVRVLTWLPVSICLTLFLMWTRGILA